MLRRRSLRSPNICIIGNGLWGKALGSLVKPQFKKLTYLGREASTKDWKLALEDAPLVIYAAPFSELEDILKKLEGYPPSGLINAAKGIDRRSLLTFTSLAQRFLSIPLATLSGPTFATEVSQKKPTACVLAGKNRNFIKGFAQRVSNAYFRMYLSDDPIGVEVCGAVKNVLAIACGISDGLHLGLNARAALLTRGLREMRTLVDIQGGRGESVFGLAGVGDLWLTATGDLSRNRQFGLQIGQGCSQKAALEKLNGICEGLYTVRQINQLSKVHKLDLPICKEVYRICFKDQDPKKALITLMKRELKDEDSNSSKAR